MRTTVSVLSDECACPLYGNTQHCPKSHECCSTRTEGMCIPFIDTNIHPRDQDQSSLYNLKYHCCLSSSTGLISFREDPVGHCYRVIPLLTYLRLLFVLATSGHPRPRRASHKHPGLHSAVSSIQWIFHPLDAPAKQYALLPALSHTPATFIHLISASSGMFY